MARDLSAVARARDRLKLARNKVTQRPWSEIAKRERERAESALRAAERALLEREGQGTLEEA